MTLVSSTMDTSDADQGARKIPLELTAYGTTPSGKPRLFVCQVCTRAFARLEHLRRHERLHTKEKPFSCGVCQRKFSRRDLLLRHAQKLHAGCADAITRLRRKSVKRSSSVGTASVPVSALALEKTDDDLALLRTPSLSYDNVNFNLNLFLDAKKSRASLVKELQRQMVDKKSLARHRGASFSAQSGENYAVGLAQFNDLYPGTDNIEFSTPQLGPSSFNDEHSWLNNLSTIPGMNGDLGDKSKKKDDLSFDNLQYMLPTATMDSSEMAASHSLSSQVLDYGYSFYDIPESMLQAKSSQYKPPNHLTPIKQEFEEDFSSHPSSIPEEDRLNGKSNTNYDLNFINDIDELTNEFDVNAKFMGSGYSFYGDNPSASSSGPDANSPPPNMNHFASPNSFLNHNQLLNIENTNSSLQKLRLGNYSKNKLFTSNMRYLINKALAKYPISGALTPSIPSNERLEFYLNTFVQGFLSHFPFIHISKLNEYEVMQMTSNEDPSNESARVCLPLLVATIGALLANNKNDSEHLYESSRRTVHIYLESRKSATVNDKASHTVNPLWLIQSLTLSVIYGLFSDNENNVFIVIRQLNALNSLVKTSIKSKRQILFSITGEDEEVYSRLSEAKTNSFLQNGSLFSDISNINDELKFKNNIAMQSQYRIVLTIYRLTSFLLMLYNIPLTLSVNDLGSIELPTTNDEFLWNFKNYPSYQEMLKMNQLSDSIENYLDSDKIIFKDLLMKVSKSAKLNSYEISQPINQSLKNLSKFGFSALVTGVFEFNQFSSTLNTPKIINNLSKYIGSQRPTNCPSNFEKVDYSMVANFVKLSSLVNIKALKEQGWLRNQNELISNFENCLHMLEASNLNNFDKILKYGVTILKFILFKVEETNEVVNLFGESDDVSFESIVNFKFTEEIDGSNHSIYSQMLFHVFVVLSMMTIIISKQNKMYPNENSYPDSLRNLNQSFKKFFALVHTAESFLKMNYTNLNDISLFYSSLNQFSHDSVDFQNTLYILRTGQAILNYIYDSKFKVSIFQKLSGNMSKIEKYLIDNETKFV